MYLKQIKAYGFKSFADKIEIEFCDNINGVVGPNGSGKSNIVDAVRWVLGEQSIKSLRGENATDIIFSGSKSRKPLNSASVTLVFDNSDRHLPIDYSEVSVKRIVYRSGENEYFLNNERCRLKDINAILVDSGAAKESFNIISQGKIDEILSTKPTDRRVIFEEAAGVLKYKKRKEEALRKLERTNDNLKRVEDIILELENSVEPLKKQSEDAKFYLATKEKLEQVEVSLIVSDVKTLTDESTSLKETITKINDEVIVLNKNNTNYDIDLLKWKNELKEIEDNLNIKQTKLLEITKNIEQADADIRLLKERKKYSHESNKINDNIVLLREDILKFDNELTTLSNDIEIRTKKITHIDSNLESLDFKYKELKKKLHNYNQLYDQNTREISSLKYKIDYLEDAINSNNLLPTSVKNILNNPRFNGVHNVIANLLEVEENYNLAIATSLGAASNYLVVDTPEVAKELVNYLKDNNLGRATFFPLSVITPRTIDNETLNLIRTNQDFLGLASDCVTCDIKYQNVTLNQLGNVIVTKSIACANYLSKLIKHRYKIVTLDGQIVNVGGSVTGGSSIKNNNIIKEKYELEDNLNKVGKLKEAISHLEREINNLVKELNELEEIIRKERVTKSELTEIINSKKDRINTTSSNRDKIVKELKDLENILGDTSDTEERQLLDSYYQKKGTRDILIKEIDVLKIDKDKLNNNIKEIEELNKSSNLYISKKEKELKELEIKASRNDLKLDNLLLSLSDEYNMTYEKAKEKYKLEIDENEAREIVKVLKSKIKNIGNINIGAIEEFERVNSRYKFLTSQKNDLLKAEDTLYEIIGEMDGIMKDKFQETFEAIRKEFKTVFRELFRGGEAELILTDPDDLLNTGIDIMAVPSGKSLKSLSLLSGGEKTFTAISLLFAILNVRPVPFCLLDEVEAALDEANVESFGQYLDKYRDKTQFILITHKKKTMEFADILYGITMQESGVSKLVSVRLEDLEEPSK